MKDELGLSGRGAKESLYAEGIPVVKVQSHGKLDWGTGRSLMWLKQGAGRGRVCEGQEMRLRSWEMGARLEKMQTMQKSEKKSFMNLPLRMNHT